MPQFIKQPTANSIHLIIRPEIKLHFVAWQAQLNALISGWDGFISLEFLSCDEQGLEWAIVQRFYNVSSLSDWQNSSIYKKLMAELHTFASASGIEEKTAGEELLKNGITEVIITHVNPLNEKPYREWSAKIHQIEATFEGFRGVYIQSPHTSGGEHWITLLQFDTAQHLDRWLESPERQKILKESSDIISSLETHRMASPYAGWFYSIAKNAEIPSVWKQTMLVLLVLFPIVMLEMQYLSPLLKGVNTSLAMFIGNILSVSLIAFPMMPLVIRGLSWWLFPQRNRTRQMTWMGLILVILLYLIEIAFFWS